MKTPLPRAMLTGVGETRRFLWRVTGRVESRARQACRAYCQAAVRRSLVTAPLGGHDWFWDIGPAAEVRVGR